MTRICAYSKCDVAFEPKRPHHRFHQESCRYADWEERQEHGGEGDAQRVGGGVGSRGGNVRDLDTGYCHADDLDPLGIPPQHCNLKGTRFAWFRNQGFMEKTGAERKVAHKAANGRKAAIHRITAKGRRELTVGVDVSHGAASREAEDSVAGQAGIHPGGQVAAGVDSEHREGSAAKSHDKPDGTLDRPAPHLSAGDPSGARPAVDPGGAPDVKSHASGDAARPLTLLPEVDPEAWAA